MSRLLTRAGRSAPTGAVAGFTLIELLVVIGILSLLIVAFAPDIIGARTQADKAADQANLRWHHQKILIYKQNHNTWPRGGGSQWLLDPWVRGDVEHTEENFNRYWTPGLTDENKQALLDMGVDNIWRSQDEITSLDTHYAARGKHSRVRRLESGKIPWVANDNEGGPTFPDGTVHVLMGSGVVRTLNADDFAEYGYDLELLQTQGFPVGPDSPHPLLQQLEK